MTKETVSESQNTEATVRHTLDTTTTESLKTETSAETEIFIPLDVPLNADLQEYIYNKCKDVDIQFELVIALIETESGYDAEAISKTGCCGLMQISPINNDRLNAELGVTDIFDPYQNIDSGVFILSELFEQQANTHLILMVYNMGLTGAARYWKQGVYSTKYTQKIIKRTEELQSENLNDPHKT